MDEKTKQVVQELIQAMEERQKSGKNYPLVSKEDLLPVLIKYLKLHDTYFKKFYKVNSSRDYNCKEMDSYKECILDTAGVPKNYRDIYHTLLYDFCDNKISAEEVLDKLLNFKKRNGDLYEWGLARSPFCAVSYFLPLQIWKKFDLGIEWEKL